AGSQSAKLALTEAIKSLSNVSGREADVKIMAIGMLCHIRHNIPIATLVVFHHQARQGLSSQV
ncbi:hypothetical protein, partial [Kosakonia sp. MH5]|uniref:hypothetical protein n=1 Tax=Kosakonia sp. MH5 TaxID=2202822 RepID=UPI001F313E28